MKKTKWMSRLLSGTLTSAMLIQSLPFLSIGQVVAADREAEEALREELAAYAADFPDGAVSFYEDAGSVTEGGEDREIVIVRLGDPSAAMSVDVKAYDVTAQYGTDYTLYTKVKMNKTFADDSQVTAPKVQTAMENGEFQEMADQATAEEALAGEPVAPAEEAPEEYADEADYEIVSASLPEQEEDAAAEPEVPRNLRDAYRQQTGQDTVSTNWRGEYEKEQLEEAAKQADNEVVDSFNGAYLTLDFAPGEYKKSVWIHVEDDDKSEGSENTALILGNASSGLIGQSMQYNVTIEDNDPDEALVFAMKDAEIVTDRSATYAEVTVERTSGLNYYANLSYRTASGTAESNEAYIPEDSGSLNFAPGQTEQTLRIELTEDAEIGTYFTVLIDEQKNNAEENRAETRVWIGSKNSNAEDLLDGASAAPLLPVPSKLKPVTAPIAEAANDSGAKYESIGGNTYLAVTVPSSELGAKEKSHKYNLPYLKDAAYIRVRYSGFICADLGLFSSGGTYVGSRYVGAVIPGSNLYEVGHCNSQELTINGSAQSEITDIICYLPTYNITTAHENQKLTGKNYKSLKADDYVGYEVPAIKNWTSLYAGEKATLNSDQRYVTPANFSSRLEEGIVVSGYDVYAGAANDHTYISDVMLVGYDKYNDAANKVNALKKEGWNYINQDLNKNAGGHYIYLMYKTTPNYSDAIKGFVVRVGSSNNTATFIHNGRNYHLADYVGDNEFTKHHGDMNEEAGGSDLFLYYTKENSDGYGITGISFSKSYDGAVTDTDLSAIDLNKKAGGDDIYMHVTSALTTYIGKIDSNELSYDAINKLNNSLTTNKSIRAANYKLFVTPHYTALPAEVVFTAEDGSAVSFNGDKEDNGFCDGDVLHCTQIDKVTMTAIDATNGQKIYPSNIRCRTYDKINLNIFGTTITRNVPESDTMLYSKNQVGKSRLSKTVEINDPQVEFLAMYTRPTLTFRYHPDEMDPVMRTFGAVTVAQFDTPDKLLGTSNYMTPLVISTDDLSLLRNSYLGTALIGDGRDFYDAEITIGGEKMTVPARTATLWCYTDKAGVNQVVKGNSFVFSPYFGAEDVKYYFQMEQKNLSPVGLSGKVFIIEEPLFYGSAQGTEFATPAVGVDLLIGGYDAKTRADGSYEIGKHFNKGDSLSIFAKYNTLTAVDNVTTAEDLKHDVMIKVKEADRLNVTSSRMEKEQVIAKAQFDTQRTYRRQDAEAMTLEDTKYYLTVNAEGQAGVTPCEAEFRVYSKEGDLKTKFTKRVPFEKNKPETETDKTDSSAEGKTADLGYTLTYELNPMSMDGVGSLAVGDTFTVTLYDTEGVEYFEHHTGIVVAEQQTGMYLFNYDSWKNKSDSLFVKAMGNISYAYDFGMDILNSDGLDYRDSQNRVHHFCSIGFGAGYGNPLSVYQMEQSTINMIDEMVAGTYTPTPQDALSFFGGSSKGAPDEFKPTGNSAWSMDIQIGMILDCILDESDGAMKGKYYFSDYVLVATATADIHHEWNVPVKAVNIKIQLHFNVGKLPDGNGSGIRWHFFADPTRKTRKYLTDNSTIEVLDWEGTKNHGDIGFDTSIQALIDVEAAGGAFTVGGGLKVELQNNVIYNDVKNPDGEWTDIGMVVLSPDVHIKLAFLKIPLWSTKYRWDWGNDNIHNGHPVLRSHPTNEPPTNQEIQEDILFTKTSDREIVDYSELYADRAWGGTNFLRYAPGKPASANEVTEKVLQTGFYDETDIRVSDLGGGKYLATFIDLVPGRETPDAFGAYYSVYNGTTWSVPQLLEDDGTADNVPTVCNAGSKGWLIVWSDASRTLGTDENICDILNTYDLTGRFFDPETNTLGDVMEITSTTEIDESCDISPEISYYEENGQEFMKIYYTKSDYEVTSEEEGEVIGDILNPYEVKAVRNYDFENDTWATDYFGTTREEILRAGGQDYLDYYINYWYGQEFLNLAPVLSVSETTDEDGFWTEGTTATVANADFSEAMAKDSAVITYNHLSLFAYSLDKGSMEQEDHDENLYLQIYNYHDDEYHHPILLSGKDADISDLQFVRMPVANSTEEATYLYWLEDSVIKRLNISSLVKNSLVLGKTADGREYYYIDKSSADVFKPAEILAEPTVRVNRDGEETVEHSIATFKVKQNGNYNYMLWTETLQQPIENEDDPQRIEQQLFAMREDTTTGEFTYPIQLTDKPDQIVHRFDFVVTDNGELDVLADRMMLNEEGEPDQTTSALVAFHFKPADKLAVSETADPIIALNDDGKLSAQVDVTLENRSFNTQKDVTITVKDANDQVITSAAEEDAAAKLSMLGGQSITLPAYLPMSNDGKYAGKIIVSANGTEIETRDISGQLHPELNAQGFTASITNRNELSLSADILNTNFIPSGTETVTYGYLDADGNQVALGTETIDTLAYNEQTAFTAAASVDFSKFTSQFAEDGTLTDSMTFYLACDDFYTVTTDVSLTATTSEYALMTGMKNAAAKPSQYQVNGDLETPETFEPGDKAMMNLWIGDDFAQNQPEYVNRTKLVWNESEDDVASVTRDGIVTANGTGTTKLSGYIVPNDTASIVTVDGISEPIDNYDIKPSAVIIPITATVTVDEPDPDTTEPGTEATEPTESTDEPGTEPTDPAATEPKAVYSPEKIREMAERDYRNKNCVTAADSEVFENEDGTVTVTLTDDQGSVIEVYTIDPATGKGTDQNGKAVDLPQTGVTSKTTAATAGGAAIAIIIGAFAIAGSGILRRKRKDV